MELSSTELSSINKRPERGTVAQSGTSDKVMVQLTTIFILRFSHFNLCWELYVSLPPKKIIIGLAWFGKAVFVRVLAADPLHGYSGDGV